jgi:23S rRNA-/tRNA-specific pseudouridylate synthase
MIAKKKQILSQLMEDFKSHKKITKTYYAICFGRFPQKSGTITKRLLRIENAKNSDKVKISEK